MNYKLTVDTNGNILNQYRTSETQPDHNTVDADGNICVDSLFLRDPITHYWGGEGWLYREVPPTDWHVWENGEWVESLAKKEIVELQAMLAVRRTRNALLYKSDWTQLNDAPLTDEKKAEWLTYRTALRDITNIIVTNESLVSWPVEPS
jgi:hypothetical protein